MDILEQIISVPIRGLFNLTRDFLKDENLSDVQQFPSPSGDYLI